MTSIQWIQLILALSLLVVIHELGHFTFARLFKVRVEKFYMFFNWKISLFRAKKFDGKWHVKFFATNDDEEWDQHPEQTEWGIGWIPFGGYCSIAGMVDETKGADDIPSEPQPWEYRSKKAWQRLLIILGGILVNFIAALVMYGAILHHWGTASLPLSSVDNGLYFSPLMEEEGFRQQDRIIAIGGEEPESLSDIVQALIIEGKRNVTVLRGGETIPLLVSEDLGTRYLAIVNEHDKKERAHAHMDKTYQKRQYTLLFYYVPFVIDSVVTNNAAYFGGMQKGDSVVSINGEPTPCTVMVQNALAEHPCDSITVGYYRAGEYGEARLFIGDHGKMGVIMKPVTAYYDLVVKEYGWLEAIPAGIEYGWSILESYVRQFRLVFTKEGAESIGGFGAIGNMFPKLWDWYTFWTMTAFLSLILAFMNFLPIPALDGGYVLLLLIEMLTGKQLPDKWLERINTVGFWLLIALLIYANGNDIFKAFF